MSIIEFNNVSYSYNAGQNSEQPVLSNFSLKIEEGQLIALVGHNGSGKSTIAKLMNGLITPTNDGEVIVDGKSTKNNKELFEIRKTVGVVFQNPDNQMVATIIEDDVAFGPENLGLKSDEIRERVDWALASVGMTEHAKGTPHRLSGGQKQRVAIAGVLALRPRVIVMDESTAMLDPKGRDEVLKCIYELNRKHGITVIMITHFMEEAASADRIIVLNKGEIILDGGKEIFLEHELLANAGLDVPLATRISCQLNSAGISVRRDVTEIDELVQELCR